MTVLTIKSLNGNNSNFMHSVNYIAGPIAERPKSSDLDCGRGDPGCNLHMSNK